MSFGSNVGYGPANFAAALAALTDSGYETKRTSSLYETEPWGGAEGGSYTNAVIEVARRGTARQFLADLLRIESLFGRERERAYAPRRCDLDLLLWGEDVICEEGLIVPHPRMTQRKFVLIPLSELIPDGIHPQARQSFAALLAVCPDPLSVWPFQPTHIPPRA